MAPIVALRGRSSALPPPRREKRGCVASETRRTTATSARPRTVVTVRARYGTLLRGLTARVQRFPPTRPVVTPGRPPRIRLYARLAPFQQSPVLPAPESPNPIARMPMPPLPPHTCLARTLTGTHFRHASLDLHATVFRSSARRRIATLSFVLGSLVLGFFIVSPPPAAATAAAARLTGLSRRLVSHPTVVSWRGYAPRHGRW